MNRQTPSIVPALATCTLALAMILPAAPAFAQPGNEKEEFHYRWRLGGFAGAIAGLFLPNHGDGVLSFTPKDDRLESDLLITSEESREGEFWRYGAEIDRRSLSAKRAWSSYQWKGKSNSKSQEIDVPDVMDIASGIYAIRRDPPQVTRKMDIWSDGHIYPVVVVPRGEDTREVAGRKIPTRRYSIRGYDAPGRRKWKGSLELWLAEDAAATPIEIRIERSLADLRLEITTLPDGFEAAPAETP
jgi:Protein of unknown function (DUF3108)